jgi:hypothetical protein
VVVAYAARAGTPARDGAGRNSPFTASLLKNLETPGLEVRFLFANVRDDVMAATNREQQPFVYGSLSKEQICLNGCTPPDSARKLPDAAPAQVKPAAVPAASITEVRRDYEFALQIDTIDAWNSFVKQYPGGFYADLARARLAKLASNKPSAPEPAKPPPEQRANLVPAISVEEQRRKAEAQFFMLKVCNKSNRRASIAAIGRTSIESEEMHVEGWWNVPPHQCSNLKRYVRGTIYLFAQEDGNPAVMWQGSALRACVATPGPFDRVNRDGYKCAPHERPVSFLVFSASDESFVWNLSPLGR